MVTAHAPKLVIEDTPYTLRQIINVFKNALLFKPRKIYWVNNGKVGHWYLSFISVCTCCSILLYVSYSTTLLLTNCIHYRILNNNTDGTSVCVFITDMKSPVNADIF